VVEYGFLKETTRLHRIWWYSCKCRTTWLFFW